MNLNKLVIDKIKQLGPTKAAAYFGVSVPTIYSWRQKNNAPVSAAQKVMDEEPEGAYAAPPEQTPPPSVEAPPTAVAPPATEAPPPEPKIEHIETPRGPTSDLSLGETINDHETRIAKLERWIIARTEGHVPATSHVAPFSNPNSGMEVKSGVVVVGQRPAPPDAPPAWNEPPKADSTRSSGGWNEPVKETLGRSPASDWNKPHPKPKEQAQ